MRGTAKAIVVTAAVLAVGALASGGAAAARGQVYWRSIRNGSLHHPSKDVVRPRYHMLLSDRSRTSSPKKLSIS
jgi:hypothetical protein